MPRWLTPLLLGTVSVASGAMALTTSARLTVPDGPATAAPVLSARRAPGVVARVVADQRLRAAVATMLDDAALGAARENLCLVVNEGLRPVLARSPDASLIPASTLKVLTASAVLARISPDERLVTEVRAARPVGSDGIVEGDLWVVGGGDPLLATAEYAASFPNQPQVTTPFERLADVLVEAGVRQVRGSIVGDESRYDTQRYIPSWRPSYRADGEVGPASALAVNDGFVALRPRAVAADQPAAYTASVLTGLLEARGVVVSGLPGQGQAPGGTAVVAALPSPPVGTIVGQMLRESDNVTAELLVKELGVRFGGAGTTEAGLRVVRDTLEGAGLPVDQLATVDGSGLDRSDRASCSLLLSALIGADPTGAVVAGFPVAARDGTLSMRFGGHPAAGRLRAKTGSLSGVAGLAGFLDIGAAPAPLTFVLLVNELPRDALGRQLQEDLAGALARYPDAPAPATIGVP